MKPEQNFTAPNEYFTNEMTMIRDLNLLCELVGRQMNPEQQYVDAAEHVRHLIYDGTLFLQHTNQEVTTD